MEAQRSGAPERVQAWKQGGWRSWRSGDHAGMELQNSGDLEVWRLWKHGSEAWRPGGRVGMEVWRACRRAGMQACRQGGLEARSRGKR
jgi:hypothetical protein